MNAKSIKGKSVAEIKIALQESMADGFKPTLAIIFISSSLDREAIGELFDAKGIAFFGANPNSTAQRAVGRL